MNFIQNVNPIKLKDSGPLFVINKWKLKQYVLQRLSRMSHLTICKPTVFALRLTYDCNLHCEYCFLKKMIPSGGIRHEELDTNAWLSIIHAIKQWAGMAYVTFTGGEPLLRKDVFELIDFATKNNLVTCINTNGSFSNPTLIRKICNTNFHAVRISLDCFGKTSERLSGKNRSFKKAMILIDSLKANNKNIIIRTVLNKKNLKSIDTLVELATEKSIKLEFTPVLGLEDLKALRPSRKDINLAIDKILSFKKNGAPIVNSTQHLELMRNYFYNPRPIFKLECPNLYQRFNINPYGDFIACRAKIGNVKYESLKELWNSKNMSILRRKTKKCQRCTLAYSID